MHNMVVENEYRAEDWGLNTEEPMQQPNEYNALSIHSLHDARGWERLRTDLVHHIWERHHRRAADDDWVAPNPRDNPIDVHPLSNDVATEADEYELEELDGPEEDRQDNLDGEDEFYANGN